MKEQKITFPLKINKDCWNIFKDLTPRTKTINEVVCELIYKYIHENSEDVDMNDPEFKKWYNTKIKPLLSK